MKATMDIKFGHHNVEVSNADIIMYNGSCYQLINRRITLSTHRKGVCDTTLPTLAKNKASILIKEGKLVEVKKDESRGLIYFKFNI